ncbi:MAG: hypothetical protein RL268_856 [Pseudomonadota bacterium]|jgi:hypothetical protein
MTSFIMDLFPPSRRDDPPAQRAAEFLGHAMLGACAAPIWGGVVAALFIGAVYWLWKEWGDLRRGGGIRDGLIDAGAVTVGAMYSGPAWWPLGLSAVAAVYIIKAVLR